MTRKTIKRTLSKDWSARIDEAVCAVCHDARITRVQLGEALCIDSSYFSDSSRNNPRKSRYLIQALPQACHFANLLPTIEKLRLGVAGGSVIKRFFQEVMNITFELDALSLSEEPVPPLKEAIDVGLMGVELYHSLHWEAGLEHMRRAWQTLKNDRLEKTSDYFAALRVGTTLLDYNGFAGSHRDSVPISGVLQRIKREYADSDKQILQALSDSCRARATTLRHLGRCPEEVIPLFAEANRIVMAGGFGKEKTVSALRGIAKPLMKSGLERLQDREKKWSEALQIIESADDAVGGENPREDMLNDWIFTRLTWAEMLAVSMNSHAAGIVIEPLLENTTVQKLLLNKEVTPYTSKFDFAQIAIAISNCDLDTVEAITKRIAKSYPEEHAQKRKQAQVIGQYALAGEIEKVRRILME